MSIVVSIDPRTKAELAAAKKASYVMYYGDSESAHGWHFMTGEEANIKALADAVGFGYEYDPKADQYAHSSGIMILTPDGKIARYFLGLSYPARDMRNAIDDAAAGEDRRNHRSAGAPAVLQLRSIDRQIHADDAATRCALPRV